MATDNFNVTDGTVLGTSPSDTNWVVSGSGLRTYSGILRHVAWGGNTFARYGTSSSDTSEAVLQANIPNGMAAGLIVRASSTYTRGYMVNLTSNGTNYTVGCMKNGDWLSEGSINIGTMPVNTSYTIKVVASGTTTVKIELFVDGVSKGYTSDSSSPYTSGSPGLRGGDSGTAANVFDDWNDGASVTYSGAGTLTISKPTCSGTGVEFDYSGSGTLTTKKPTCSGSGTYTTVYWGSGTFATKKPTIVATATYGIAFAINTSTGEITVSDTSQLAGGQTWSVVVRVTDSLSNVAQATVEIDVTALNSTGSGSIVTNKPTVAGSGAFTPPSYTGHGTVNTTHLILTGYGVCNAPDYAGIGALQTLKPTITGHGFGAIPVTDGIGALVTRKATIQAEAAYTAPSYDTSATLQTRKPTILGNGTYAPAIYEGLSTLVIQKPTLSGSGIFFPLCVGTGSLTTTKTRISATGIYRPIYTGTGGLTTRRLVLHGSDEIITPSASNTLLYLLLSS